jgi:group I intron endonuclease
MFYKIYLITNLLNKKQYVGITKFSIEERFLQHTRRGFLLTEAIQKYGKEQFLIELIEKVESIERAYELEQYYIKKYDTKVPSGYNLTDGGDGLYGVVIDDEDRKRRSKVMKKLHKEKRTGMHGKKHTEETKKKMSETAKGKEKPWLIGKKKSDETKEKIRQSNIGKVLSKEIRKKISENHHNVSGENNPMYGKKHSQETIEKIRQKQKNREKRVWINDGKIEKLILAKDELPKEFNYGRILFKQKKK